MRILIAEDEPITRSALQATLTASGYQVVATADGESAWNVLDRERGIRLALLDWMMPGLDGTELCRRLRQRTEDYVYIIFLTVRNRKEDVIVGLQAGADDYITKPFDPQELSSRIRAGERILSLESRLEQKVHELEEALAHVKRLQGMLPICMHCKKVRDDRNVWHLLESYVQQNSEAIFTHSLCQDCLKVHYPTAGQKVSSR